MDVGDLGDREAEEIDAERGAEARHRHARAAEETRVLGIGPCHAGVVEARRFDGRDARRAQQSDGA